MDRTALQALPKAELHVHIEGTLEPEQVFEFAARNRIAPPNERIEDLRARYDFADLQSFLDLYYECSNVLQTAADFADLAAAYLRRVVADGVRHAEIFFDPQAHTSRGIDVNIVLDGLETGFARVAETADLSGGFILSFLRDRPVAEAAQVLESLAPRADELIGVGLDSAELGYPPERFAAVFSRAAELGLHRVAHAGEEGPAAYVRSALDALHVERIDHGNHSLDDPQLTAELAERQVPLTVCPLSNLRLGGVASLAAHPLPTMVERGLLVTLNSDDPAYFGGYLVDNYAAVAEHCGITDAQLVTIARNSVRASFADTARQTALEAEIDSWAEQHR